MHPPLSLNGKRFGYSPQHICTGSPDASHWPPWPFPPVGGPVGLTAGWQLAAWSNPLPNFNSSFQVSQRPTRSKASCSSHEHKWTAQGVEFGEQSIRFRTGSNPTSYGVPSIWHVPRPSIPAHCLQECHLRYAMSISSKGSPWPAMSSCPICPQQPYWNS